MPTRVIARYEGDAVLVVADGTEHRAHAVITVEVEELDGGVEGLRSWSGTLDADADWYDVSAQELQLRVNDRVATFVVPAINVATLGTKVKIVGSGPAPIDPE
jgi:hypothetical protein